MATRHTKSRQAVLRAVKLSPRAISADQVLTRVKPWWPEANRATVYRNLDFLTKRGEVYRLEGEDGTKQYIGHSFHEIKFRCQRCGEVRKLAEGQLQKFVEQNLSGHQTVFFSKLVAQGLCLTCQKELKS